MIVFYSIIKCTKQLTVSIKFIKNYLGINLESSDTKPFFLLEAVRMPKGYKNGIMEQFE